MITELFQIVGRLKIANGIELRLQDKKLKRKLTFKTKCVQYNHVFTCYIYYVQSLC